MLELFTTSTCTKCAAVEEKMAAASIPFVKRVIDLDPEAETDALLLGIRQVPALFEDKVPVSVEEIFVQFD